MSDVAVVVLNYNGRHLLAECLDSLQALSTQVEVVVADNGSTDGSLDFVRQGYPSIRTIDLGSNLGYAAGYNAALATVEAKWLVLVNSDAALESHYVERLLNWAAERPRVAILGGKLLFAGSGMGEPAFVQCAGASFTEAGTAFEIGWGELDHGQYDGPRLVGAISGAALLVRRDVFQELGGFDASYEAYLEDVDLCWRAWLYDYEVQYVPAAVAHHHFGASAGGRDSPYRIRLMQRNRLANMVKNLELTSLPWGLVVSGAYDAYRMFEYLRRGQMGALRALASGSWSFACDFRKIVARRAPTQRIRKLSDRELRQRGLLVPALSAFREYRRLERVAR